MKQNTAIILFIVTMLIWFSIWFNVEPRQAQAASFGMGIKSIEHGAHTITAQGGTWETDTDTCTAVTDINKSFVIINAACDDSRMSVLPTAYLSATDTITFKYDNHGITGGLWIKIRWTVVEYY